MGAAAAAELVPAAAETTPVASSGDAADDPAIWVHPTNRSRSIVIGTDKRGGLAVYDLAGRQLAVYGNGRPNNVDVRGNLVAVSERATDSIRLYRVDPKTRALRDVSARTIGVGMGLYGLCMYRNYVFVSDSSGTMQQWQLFTVGTKVDARKVRTIRLSSVSEGCVADDELRRLYVAQEDEAIWRYDAEPAGGSARTLVDSIGPRLTADIEGLTIYRKGRNGYLIASSQGSDDFAVYDRRTNTYVGRFAIGGGAIDKVKHTDGIDVTSLALGPRFPRGLFVAQDNWNDGGNQNFKLVRWDAIARALAIRLRTDAAARYVDAVAGSDANDGTSPARAWRTLGRATGVAPGTRLLLRRGGVWRERLDVNAARVVVAPYGTGPRPAVERVSIAGSGVRVRGLAIGPTSWAGVEIIGDDVTLEGSLVTGNAAGVYVKRSAERAKILRNVLRDNNRMSVLTREPRSDDSGAFGVLLHGDRAEVAYNTITGSAAFSYDYGRDGAAIEVYGARNANVHHNLAVDNDAFVELGESRSSGNTFAYNVVRASIPDAVGVVTRGAESARGPVLATKLDNNTIVLTGAGSEGVVCHAGCAASILRMRNNVVHAVGKAAYADAPFDEDYDLFSGGPARFARGPHSRVTPSVDARAAIDAGVALGYKRDFAGRPVPLDGDGDGRRIPDVGAYEYRR